MAARLACLALVLGLLLGASAQDDNLDAIVQKAWERHQEYVAKGVYTLDSTAEPTSLRAHKCVHNELMNERSRQEHLRNMRARQNPSSPEYREAISKRSARQTSPQPIRFYADTRLLDSTNDPSTCYTAGATVTSYQNPSNTLTCQSNALVTDSVRQYLTLTVIPTTVSTFQSLLNVYRRTGNLVVGTSDLCSNVPSSFVNSVPNADYYMFFSARAVQDTSTIATAEACSLDPVDGHPFVGLVNFNPASFQKLPSNFFAFKQALRVAMHEFTHALGFSSGLYSSYRNATGQPYPASAFPRSGLTYTGIATPRVLAWARPYFNCPSLTNVPLENDGGSGTAGSHWEQAAVYDEYMVGIATQFFPITNLTLSLLADSGWYYPVFSNAEDLSWGWQKGCQFLGLSCTDANWNVLGPTDAYECSGTQRGCTADRLAIGICTATVSSDSVTMKGCNFFSTQSPATYCQANGTEADGVIGDFYCPQCRCFSVNNAATSTRAGCFQVQCVRGVNTTQLKVQKGNTWYDCPADGSAGSFKVGSSVPGIDTTIYCPPSLEICRQVSINAAQLVPYKKKTGYKWLYTNSSLAFWGMVAGVLVVGMIAICIFMCLCSAICSCICGSKRQGARNRALMLRR